MFDRATAPLPKSESDLRPARGVSAGAMALSASLLFGVAVLARIHDESDGSIARVIFLVGGIASMLQGGGLLFSLVEHIAGRSIRRGEHLAHWVLEEVDGGGDADGRGAPKAVLPVAGAVVFALPFVLLFSLGAVPAGVALQVLSTVVLLVPAVALPLLLDRIAGKIRGRVVDHREQHEVVITFSGIQLRGEWYRWGDPQGLVSGSFDPRQMKLSVGYRAPSDPRVTRTVVVAVPPGHEVEARRVLAALGLASRAPAPAAIRSSIRSGPRELYPHPFQPRQRRSVLQRRREPVLLGLSASCGFVVMGLMASDLGARFGLFGVAGVLWLLSIGGLFRLFERWRARAWKREAAGANASLVAAELIPMSSGEALGLRLWPVAPVAAAVRQIKASGRLLDGGARTGDAAFDALAGVSGPHAARVAVFDAEFRARFVEVARHHDLSVAGGQVVLVPGGYHEWWPPARRRLFAQLVDLAARLVVAESEFGARIEAAARDGRDPGPAFDALQVLRRLDPAAAGPIEAGFAESADPRVRLMLGELRGRDGVELMEPLFEHSDPEVRLRAAADLVAWLPPMEAAERAAMWSADDDVALRETALWVAARRGLPAFAVPDAVLRGLPVDVALDVIGWVSKLPPADSQPVLIALFGHPERLVAISALHAIGATGTPSALAAVHRTRAKAELIPAALRAVDLIKARHTRRVGGGGLALTSGEYGRLPTTSTGPGQLSPVISRSDRPGVIGPE